MRRGPRANLGNQMSKIKKAARIAKRPASPGGFSNKRMARPGKKDISLEVDCPALPSCDSRELKAVQKAFQSARPIPFRQAWRPRKERAFMPGFVRVGWNEGALLAFAELSDVEISTRADGPNQRLWALGDVLELFLQPAGQSAYAEFQVAPNNCQLQLVFPDAKAVIKARAANDFKPFMIWSKSFQSRTWVRPAEQRWYVFVKVPQNLVCERHKPLQGQRWRFSFSRFDYTGGKRVASSTSPHQGTEFHSQEEWGALRFV